MLYYFLAVFAAVSFAGLGLTYKYGNKINADNDSVNTVMFFSSLMFSVLLAFVSVKQPFNPNAVLLGAVLGLAGFGAVWAYREVASRGPLATSWTINSLSLIIPVLVSILIWKEKPSITHMFGFAFTVATIVLIGFDMRKKG